MPENFRSLIEQNEEKIEQVIKEQLDASDRDELVIAVRNDYKAIVQALIDSAKGMWVEKAVPNEDGTIKRRIYNEKPNTDVAQYLLNQLVGKPKETQVMEGRVTFIRDF